MRTRYWGPFKQEWYSVCSRLHHPDQEAECAACNAGSWQSVWGTCISQFVYKWWPDLWIWWVNRPNSRTRKELERIFPKLRRDK